MFIDAEPEDVGSYLRLRTWLDSLQSELDTSWAVLGEVYGRFSTEGFDRLLLRLRRIRSNTDNLEEFSKRVGYVPAKVAFEVVSPDLLRLLVAPLYGARPAIGVRELVQNAVDAVRELDTLRRVRPDIPEPSSTDPDVEIVITIQAGTPSELRVTDRGIGMTLDVIKDYFLKAGASFRSSEAWRKQFEDESGKQRVLRAGRFGIGALAAFLLGDEIDIVTRHIDAAPERGIRFKARLDTDQLELRYTTQEVGTTISIRLNESAQKVIAFWIKSPDAEDLSFYCFKSPKVVRTVMPKGTELPQLYEIDVPASKPYRTCKVNDFDEIAWTYEKEVPALVCNGLIVRGPGESLVSGLGRRRFGGGAIVAEGLELRYPAITVVDREGRLPLNLQRTALASNELPFEREVFYDVVLAFVEFLIKNLPEGTMFDSERHQEYFAEFEAAHRQYDRTWPLWAQAGEGAVVADYGVLRKMGVSSVLWLPRMKTGGRRIKAHVKIPREAAVVGFEVDGARIRNREWQWVGPFFGRDRYYHRESRLFGRQKGIRMAISTEYWKRIEEARNLPKYMSSRTLEADRIVRGGEWVYVECGACNEEAWFDFDRFTAMFEPDDFASPPVVSECHGISGGAEGTELGNAWSQAVEGLALPFKGAEREGASLEAIQKVRDMVGRP